MTNTTTAKTHSSFSFITLLLIRVAVLIGFLVFGLTTLYTLVSARTNTTVAIIAVVATIAVAVVVSYVKKR